MSSREFNSIYFNSKLIRFRLSKHDQPFNVKRRRIFIEIDFYDALSALITDKLHISFRTVVHQNCFKMREKKQRMAIRISLNMLQMLLKCNLNNSSGELVHLHFIKENILTAQFIAKIKFSLILILILIPIYACAQMNRLIVLYALK